MWVAPILLLSGAAVAMKPIEPWVVAFDDEKCMVTRNYGTKEEPVTLAVKPSPFRGAARLVVVENGRGPNPGEQYPATVQVNETAPLKTNMLVYELKGHRAFALAIPMFRPGYKVERIHFAGQGADYIFETPNLSGAVAMLDECLTDLRAHWNADEKASQSVATPATPIRPLGSFFDARDYPADAMRQRQEGSVLFSLLIDEMGSVRDCSVFISSGVASLDTMSCYRLVGKAKFKPALDKAGKPVKSVYFQTVKWRMG